MYPVQRYINFLTLGSKVSDKEGSPTVVTSTRLGNKANLSAHQYRIVPNKIIQHNTDFSDHMTSQTKTSHQTSLTSLSSSSQSAPIGDVSDDKIQPILNLVTKLVAGP